MSDKQATPSTVEAFRALVRSEPTEGIKQLAATYRLMEKDYFKGDYYIRNLAGGVPEGISWGLYNAIGEAYPALSREQKDLALRQTFAIMDETTYTIVNGLEGAGHTTGIREPFYLGEIATARRMYWPGLDEGKNLIKLCYGNFDEVKFNLMTKEGTFKQDRIHSDFLVAYAFLRSDFSNFGESFAEAFDKPFMDRTVTAIVKMRIRNAKTESEVSAGLDRLKFLLPKSLHGKIEAASKSTGWVDSEQFP